MLCRFAFLIFSHESLLIRLLIRCFDMRFPVRTPLHNLFAFVHPKVVSVFSKLSSQRIDGYNNFCYHISPFFALLRIESVVSSRPFRDHPERYAYMRDPFPEFDDKDTMNILGFANFLRFFLRKTKITVNWPRIGRKFLGGAVMKRRWSVDGEARGELHGLQNCVRFWEGWGLGRSHYNNIIILYIMAKKMACMDVQFCNSCKPK